MMPDKNEIAELRKKYLKTEHFRSDVSPYQKHNINLENKRMLKSISKLKPLYETKRILKETEKQRTHLDHISTSHIDDRAKDVPPNLRADVESAKFKTLSRQLKLGTSFDDRSLANFDAKSKYSATNIRIQSAITARDISNFSNYKLL